MRILVAPDSFKGTLSAAESAEAMAEGIREGFSRAGHPPPELVLCPLADGGEGTAAILAEALGGRWVPATVTGPLPGRTVEAGYVEVPGEVPGAIVELAAASGLGHLAVDERDPLRTTTAGTGELIRLAAQGGAGWIWLTLGGSATVDGGTGMATALGWRFLDWAGAPVPPGGGALESIASIQRPGVGELTLPPITVLRDVDNPLLGPSGAAPVFGPQKGASPLVVDRLASGLGRLADLAEEGRDSLRVVAGAGAAGGAGFGAMVFLGAEMKRGFRVVADAVELESRVRDADVVVTGEGRLDSQSLEGKVVAGVLEIAGRVGVPVDAVVGREDLGPPAVSAAGLRHVEATNTEDLDSIDAATRARRDVSRAAARLTERWTSQRTGEDGN